MVSLSSTIKALALMCAVVASTSVASAEVQTSDVTLQQQSQVVAEPRAVFNEFNAARQLAEEAKKKKKKTTKKKKKTTKKTTKKPTMAPTTPAPTTKTPVTPVTTTKKPSGKSTMYVQGRHLYDRCGEQVILRGVNEMVVWAGADKAAYAKEVAKSGANVVRIVWNGKDGTAEELDTAIQAVVDLRMIPIIENHDATGDLPGVVAVVDWWVQSKIVAVVKKHQKYLLLNIANEAGDSKVTSAEFTAAYKKAISRMRAAGIEVPLIIDGPAWGQDIDVLQASGPDLIASDPLKNTLFSVHMWWSDPKGDRVKTELQQSVDMGLPLIVGEFAQHAVYLCDQSPFAYEVLLEQAQKHSVGWLAWSWGAVPNGDCKDKGSFDMTVNGKFGQWTEKWGEVVMVSSKYSVKNTSVRPYSMVNGQCKA